MDGSIYKGPDYLFRAAEEKGFISVVNKNKLDSFLEKQSKIEFPQNDVPIRVLKLKEWLEFLKNVNKNTTNAAESHFTAEMIFVFEMVNDAFEKIPIENIIDTPQKEILFRKEIIGDNDIQRLQEINSIDDILNENNGFFG